MNFENQDFGKFQISLLLYIYVFHYNISLLLYLKKNRRSKYMLLSVFVMFILYQSDSDIIILLHGSMLSPYLHSKF